MGRGAPARDMDPTASAPWTIDEDERIYHFILNYGEDFDVLARALPGRTRDALRKRAHALIVLRRPPTWFRGTPRWSEVEDDALQALVRAHGKQWSQIAAHFLEIQACNHHGVEVWWPAQDPPIRLRKRDCASA